MATSIEIIRANLPGLPDEITDTVIQIIIDTSKTLHDAAIALCDAAASTAENTDIKVGTLSIREKSAEDWMKIKDNLIRRKMTDSGVIVNPDAENTGQPAFGMVATGDCIPRQFEEGQFDNPPEEWCC